MRILPVVLLAAAGIRAGIWLEVFHPPQVASFTRVVATDQPGTLELVATLLSVLFVLNLLLFLFNLIPAPPLDGAAVITLLMEEGTARRFREFTRSWGFAGLLLAWYFFGEIFGPVYRLALNLLYPGASYG